MAIFAALFGVVVATALVSFVAGALTRSRALAIAMTVIVVEASVLFVLYHSIGSSFSSDVPEVIGVPPFLAIAVAPFILITAFFSVRSVERMRKDSQL
jgi:hypothetical protein